MSFKIIIALNYITCFFRSAGLSSNFYISGYDSEKLQHAFSFHKFIFYLCNTIFSSRNMRIFNNIVIMWVQLSVVNMAGIELKLCSQAEE